MRWPRVVTYNRGPRFDPLEGIAAGRSSVERQNDPFVNNNKIIPTSAET
jgi:hypothetical protein